ncbi:MAG: hypothetical protein K9M80_01050 [Candidatus Marinimicrobia bacterium]|nr:hypothetical protein [Candidatus Neomarinimicrobiota bacterium]
MQRIGKTIILIIFFITLLTAYEFPVIEGWQQTDAVQIYTSDNLWNYINGAADGYLDYGFVKLKTARFKKDTNKITIDIYNMGNKLNAFGIYVAERADQYTPLRIGAESTIYPPSEANMLKDRFYVFVRCRDGEITNEMGKAILKKISQQLPGDSSLPQEFGILPQTNRVAGSEKYIKKDFLSMAQLANVILADYEQGNMQYQLFYFIESLNNADKIWSKFESKWKELQTEKPIKLREIPYQGTIGVIKTTRGVFGVTELEKEAQIVEILKSVAEH